MLVKASNRQDTVAIVLIGRGRKSEQKICGSGLYGKIFASHLACSRIRSNT